MVTRYFFSRVVGSIVVWIEFNWIGIRRNSNWNQKGCNWYLAVRVGFSLFMTNLRSSKAQVRVSGGNMREKGKKSRRAFFLVAITELGTTIVVRHYNHNYSAIAVPL